MSLLIGLNTTFTRMGASLLLGPDTSFTRMGSALAKSAGYIALQGTRQESLPHVKLGETLNFRLFGVCF